MRTISFSESDDDRSMRERAYLLRSPRNASMTLDAIAELERGGGAEHDVIDPE